MWVVGYGEIGVRDFGLAFGTFVIFMHGADLLCVQQKKIFVADTSVPSSPDIRATASVNNPPKRFI
jgi:hypothetical protein